MFHIRRISGCTNSIPRYLVQKLNDIFKNIVFWENLETQATHFTEFWINGKLIYGYGIETLPDWCELPKTKHVGIPDDAYCTWQPNTLYEALSSKTFMISFSSVCYNSIHPHSKSFNGCAGIKMRHTAQAASDLHSRDWWNFVLISSCCRAWVHTEYVLICEIAYLHRSD